MAEKTIFHLQNIYHYAIIFWSYVGNVRWVLNTEEVNTSERRDPSWFLSGNRYLQLRKHIYCRINKGRYPRRDLFEVSSVLYLTAEGYAGTWTYWAVQQKVRYQQLVYYARLLRGLGSDMTSTPFFVKEEKDYETFKYWWAGTDRRDYDAAWRRLLCRGQKTGSGDRN